MKTVSRDSMLELAVAPDIEDNTDTGSPRIETSGQQRILNTYPDVPDLRDRYYSPTLRELRSRKPPDIGELTVRDQGSEGACTGFALAHVIDLLNGRRRAELRQNGFQVPDRVSARMLYEMARLHDEWTGEDYEGSSIRGALKGFFHNGVCDEGLASYQVDDPGWVLTIEQAKDARKVGLGAYYRLQPDIIDYHAALNESEAIFVSARVHDGWINPRGGKIRLSDRNRGGHAFAIVGYDETGFFVLNSWGSDWGGGGSLAPGLAHWSYEDWGQNVLDAWVLQLSVSSPSAFDVARSRNALARSSTTAGLSLPDIGPARSAVIGHIINIDDARLQSRGTYATPQSSLRKTGEFLAEDAMRDEPEYPHLLFYAHGGLNSLAEGATRASVLRQPFKDNGVYPFFWLWGTSWDEFSEFLLSAIGRAKARVGFGEDFLDRAFERMVQPIGRPIWNQMKWDAEHSFDAQAGGTQALDALFEPLARLPADLRPKIHLVGHSAGAILNAYMVDRLCTRFPDLQIESLHMLAPGCRIDLYDDLLATQVDAESGRVRRGYLYNLRDELELADSVLGPSVYRKSILYLVSNALEVDRGTPLLGMERFADLLPDDTSLQIDYAGGRYTKSTTHRGFGNDPVTMNTVLSRVLDGQPRHRLTQQILDRIK